MEQNYSTFYYKNKVVGQKLLSRAKHPNNNTGVELGNRKRPVVTGGNGAITDRQNQISS
jgi:hypothetical protein